MPEIYDTSAAAFSARYFISNTKNKGIFDGSGVCEEHSPYAIIEDRKELRSFAETTCDRWWNSLEDHDNDNLKAQYPEIKRTYVASFMGAYLARAEALRQKEQKKAKAEDVRVAIKSHHIS